MYKSKALEKLIGYKFGVLDNGFVQVVDYMGNEKKIVDAARVSYGTGTKSVSSDRNLIRYMMRHRHTSPFEQCSLSLRVKVPMDTWRQWIRHRTASVNEYSTRYSVAIDTCQCTDSTGWRTQSTTNKQGSSENLPQKIGAELTKDEKNLHEYVRKIYNKRLEFNVAREQARKDLPLSTYTLAFWSINLHNLLHFLSLRMDSHAQLEIRQYANIIGNEIVSQWVPNVWDAFNNYKFNVINLSERDQLLIQNLNNKSHLFQELENFGYISRKDDTFIWNREGMEFKEKLFKLKLKNNWDDEPN